MQVTINGKIVALTAEDLAKGLLDYLREDLDLTGTKNGCNVGVCGACVVLVDDKPQRACRRKVVDVVDKKVVTIEGMSDAQGALHPLQIAFIEEGAVQCGFCTPGMVMSAHALLMQHATPSRAEVRRAINNNLCRCTGYQQIVDAVVAAGPAYAKDA